MGFETQDVLCVWLKIIYAGIMQGVVSKAQLQTQLIMIVHDY